MKTVKLAIGVCLLGAVAVLTTDHFASMEARRLRTQIDELTKERTELLLYAERLSAAKRVAQLNILEQRDLPSGETLTIARWQQIGPTGTLGEPEELKIHGQQLYIEAMVIKFEHDLIGSAAEDRTTNLAMFSRAFGEQQAPINGPALDQSTPPDPVDGNEHAEKRAELWRRFWDFTKDRDLAKQYGVRVAQCEAPSVKVRVGEVWEVSLDHSGGLNLRLLSRSPKP